MSEYSKRLYKRLYGDCAIGEPRRAITPEAKRELVERLLALWLEWPALRLGQLIMNTMRPTHAQLYNIEDHDLVSKLEKDYEGYRKQFDRDREKASGAFLRQGGGEKP